MYYFLSNRNLVAHEDLKGKRTPLVMNQKEEAKSFVESMNLKYSDKVFQCFYSNADIKLFEDAQESE